MTSRRLKTQWWKQIYTFLQEHPRVYVGSNERHVRKFVEALFWITRTGASWRDLPPRFGNWNSIYKRFQRWSDNDVWQDLLAFVAVDPDMEHGLVDSTIVRAHSCSAGAPRKHGGQEKQCLGRSRGGFTTKIHLIVDGLGNPLRIRLSPGQTHDIRLAHDMIENLQFDTIIADRGYAAQHFVDAIEARQMLAVIPAHQHSKSKRDYDKWLYRERHLVECCINKLKHFRRVFSRYEKLALHYKSFVCFACALIWLR